MSSYPRDDLAYRWEAWEVKEAGVNILQKNLEIFQAGKRVISSYPRKVF